MVKRTREEALQTRDQLLDAAEAVFNKKGVSQTTVNDIACAAGMTRGAVYWHFKNKVDLFNAMCDRITLPLESMSEANASDEVTDPLGELQKTTHYLFQLVASDIHTRRVFDILFNKCEFVAELGPILTRDQRVRRQFERRSERTFRNAIQRGQLATHINPRLAMHAYHSFITGILRCWLLQPDSFDLQHEGVRMINSFFEMLSLSKSLSD